MDYYDFHQKVIHHLRGPLGWHLPVAADTFTEEWSNNECPVETAEDYVADALSKESTPIEEITAGDFLPGSYF